MLDKDLVIRTLRESTANWESKCRMLDTAVKNSPFGGDIGPDYAAYDAGTEEDYDAERSKLEYAVQLRKSW
jgi:hypothetical protein